MPVETAADRETMLADFGVAATYTAAGGASAELVGIFNRPFLEVRFTHAPSASVEPSFLCRSADLPAGAKGGAAGDLLEIETEGGPVETYKVVELEPDGEGMTLISLSR